MDCGQAQPLLCGCAFGCCSDQPAQTSAVPSAVLSHKHVNSSAAPWLLLYLLPLLTTPQAERRLQEEVERVRAYLDESTEPKITKVAEHELIAKQVRPHTGQAGRAAVHSGLASCHEQCCHAVDC